MAFVIKNGSLNNVLEYISQAGGINYKIDLTIRL